MAKILAIETSTTVCSIALADGETIVAKKELFEANSHAAVLTVFIEQLFNENSAYSLDQLDAIVVSSGPGSYTGLRIGVSTAKGLCYGLNIPLIAIKSLHAMSIGAAKALHNRTFPTNTLLCPMIDARRMEVYAALYNTKGTEQEETKAVIIDEQAYEEALNNHTVIFFGNGANKCKNIITSNNAIFLDDIVPLAEDLIPPAIEAYNNNKFEDVAYFEPFYLKDFVATTPKKKIL